MILQLILLFLAQLLGRQLRKPDPGEPIAIGIPPLPAPEDADSLDPEPPFPPSHAAPPGAPNILIPKPIHQDTHGPASALARAMIRKGHVVFEKDEKSHNLNIVAIRSQTHTFDAFNDRLCHFWKSEGQWHLESWPWTTLPGKTYMIDKLLSPMGCAILVPGQYRGAYRRAKHREIYEALCQRGGNVRVYRDGNRNKVYDMVPSSIQTGSFGINVHATENPDDGISRNIADRIGSASAGCLVAARVTDFVDAREQWRIASSNWGASFTLTLLDEDDIDDLGETPLEAVAPQHSDKLDWTPPAPATTGTRNRNLLNVKQNPANPWKYSTGVDSRGHAIFPNFPAGIRAGIITLRTYWTQHGIKTLSGITARWAPATDTVGSLSGAGKNKPNEYAEFIAKQTGIPANAPLLTFTDGGQVRSPDQLFAIISAMVKMENGHHVELPRHVFDAGLELV